MAADPQHVLQKAWLGGKDGSFGALAEARAWALREVWHEDGKPEYGMLVFISARVTKVGGGNPSPAAMSLFFNRVDEDVHWFPGKHNQEKRGPKPILYGAKRQAVAEVPCELLRISCETPPCTRKTAHCMMWAPSTAKKKRL